jgi:HD superfamily phosphodiesterase
LFSGKTGAASGGKESMKEIFKKIWELALPYQDKRDDAGHAETSLKYALKLVELENVNEDVVIPAIILHDVGWSQLPEKRRMKVFDPGAREAERREVVYEHQIEGIKLALKILREVDYPPELIDEILDIISQHDTRKGFVSKNEGIVRDADKLWRTSAKGFTVAEERAKKREAQRFKQIEKGLKKEDYFSSETARKMALTDLEYLEKQKRKDKAGNS